LIIQELILARDEPDSIGFACSKKNLWGVFFSLVRGSTGRFVASREL
jgi:hypothetical protein